MDTLSTAAWKSFSERHETATSSGWVRERRASYRTSHAWRIGWPPPLVSATQLPQYSGRPSVHGVSFKPVVSTLQAFVFRIRIPIRVVKLVRSLRCHGMPSVGHDLTTPCPWGTIVEVPKRSGSSFNPVWSVVDNLGNLKNCDDWDFFEWE